MWIEPWYNCKHWHVFSLHYFDSIWVHTDSIWEYGDSKSIVRQFTVYIFFVKARWPVKRSVEYDQSQGNTLVQEFNSVANTLVRFGLLTNCIYSAFETLWNYSQFNKHKSEKDNQNNSPSRTKACKSDQKPQRSEKNPAKKYLWARYRIWIGWQQSHHMVTPKSYTSFHWSQ